MLGREVRCRDQYVIWFSLACFMHAVFLSLVYVILKSRGLRQNLTAQTLPNLKGCH